MRCSAWLIDVACMTAGVVAVGLILTSYDPPAVGTVAAKSISAMPAECRLSRHCERDSCCAMPGAGLAAERALREGERVRLPGARSDKVSSSSWLFQEGSVAKIGHEILRGKVTARAGFHGIECLNEVRHASAGRC